MKILFLIHRLTGGGAERQLSYLAPQLAAMGHELHVVYHHPCEDLSRFVGVNMHRLQLTSNYDLRLPFLLLRIVRQVRPDLVVTWIMQMDIVGGLIARLSGIPWVIREPNSVLAYPQTFKFTARKYLGLTATAIIANSDAGADYWRNFVKKERLFVVRNGFPIDEILGICSKQRYKRASSDNRFFLSVGRLADDISGRKNVKKFLEALFLFKGRCPEARAVICGEGPQKNELHAFCAQNKLSEDVGFGGFKEKTEIWKLMNEAAALVSLSSFEGCPNVVLEAMLCRCPLIVSDIPTHREILDEDSAIFVNPLDPAQIAVAFEEIVSSPDLAVLRANNAFKKAQSYSINDMARSYESVFGQLSRTP